MASIFKRKKLKYEIDVSKNARRKRREKAKEIISGNLELEEDELLDFLAEMLMDCKYDADSDADDQVKAENAEIIEQLFSTTAEGKKQR